ncbi:creatininase family protein [Sphingomonas koreensis]
MGANLRGGLAASRSRYRHCLVNIGWSQPGDRQSIIGVSSMHQSLHASACLAAALIFGTSASASAGSAADVLRSTIAEQSYPEVEKAAARGGVALWAIGAIEQHGPHLPLSTDVEIPSAQLRGVKQALSRRNIESSIVPPYYWGVNHVTGAFPGSIHVRPEIMVEVMLDVFRSLKRSGFREVYCITGHFDAAHGRAIAEAVRRANEEQIIAARFVVPDGLGERLGLDRAVPYFVFARWPAAAPAAYPDLHAGAAETSAMLHIANKRVNAALAKTLPATNLDPAQLREWRTGGEPARALTPQGIVGAPANASARMGKVRLAQEISAYASAIETSIKSRTGAQPN